MPRARKDENRGYPKSWRFRCDAYYYRVPKGQEHLWDGKKEFHLGRSLSEASTVRFTEHDLRGKVGSDLASIERATDLLGHASREITKRHYRRKPEVIKPVR
jgi:hypothetical protein